MASKINFSATTIFLSNPFSQDLVRDFHLLMEIIYQDSCFLVCLKNPFSYFTTQILFLSFNFNLCHILLFLIISIIFNMFPFIVLGLEAIIIKNPKSRYSSYFSRYMFFIWSQVWFLCFLDFSSDLSIQTCLLNVYILVGIKYSLFHSILPFWTHWVDFMFTCIYRTRRFLVFAYSFQFSILILN